jgi:hypothetical protein
MGKQDWGFIEAKAVLHRLKVRVAANSVRGLLSAGRTGRMPAPELSPEDEQRLQQLRDMGPALVEGSGSTE